MKEEGSERRMMYYQQQWELFAAKAKAKQLMPDLDGYENFKQHSERFTPHNDSYYRGFGSTGRTSNLNFSQ